VADATTVPARLRDLVSVAPDQDAVVTVGESLTWREVDARSAEVGSALLAEGITRGTRVGLLMENGVPWVVTAFAVLRIGAVLVPLSTLVRPAELEGLLRQAELDHLILTPRFRGRDYTAEFAEVTADLAWVSDLSALVGRPTDVSALRGAEGEVVADDDLVVLFTSGSSGAPKGAIHTHGGALRAVAAGLDARCVRPGERLYLPMPLFWTGGFAGGLMTVLVAGATLLTEAEPEPASTLQLLTVGGVTLFRGWADQGARLAAYAEQHGLVVPPLQPGSVGALMPAERRPERGARANLFGMTETFGPYCGDRLDADMPGNAWGSCGTPFPGVEIRIVDPDTAREVEVGQPGEIWVRGQLMRGLIGQPDAEVFTPDGWYATGDVGRLGEDGRLWYDGRVDDAMKVSGATVYPSEVEAALSGIAAVERAFVTGVVDVTGGWLIAALVIPTKGGDLTEAEVKHAARERLSAFKVPRIVRVLAPGDDAPRSATGKVDAAALRELLS
jgi:acyl-CoA synthetase (AMP-forming)/AMP-acid ligase II